MGGHFRSFFNFLDSEKALKRAREKAPTLRTSAKSFTPSSYALRLAQSYVIETRTAIVEEGSAEIWSVGTIARQDSGVGFKPDEQLKPGTLLLRELVRQFFEVDVSTPQSHSGTELFEAIGTVILEKDQGLETLRGDRQDEGAMEVLWKVFGAAVHDQISQAQPVELETIGTFVPAGPDTIVRFLADEHLLNLIAGNVARGSSKIRSARLVGEPRARKPEAADKAQPPTATSKSPSAKWGFLKEERDLYPSDERPLEGMIRDLNEKAKGS